MKILENLRKMLTVQKRFKYDEIDGIYVSRIFLNFFKLFKQSKKHIKLYSNKNHIHTYRGIS